MVFDSHLKLSYKSDNLIDAAMTYLRCRDVRDLVRLGERPREWKMLQSFLKRVTVQVTVAPHIKRKIEELVLNAGSIEFTKEGGSTTVQVGGVIAKALLDRY